MLYKICFRMILLFFIFIIPSEAAIDLSIKGSVTSEMTLLPGNIFLAGNRTRMYSELVKTGAQSFFGRIWFFNQKFGELSRYDAVSDLYTENLIEWAEMQLTGELIPNGPNVRLHIGNFELDYSPYIICGKDNGLSKYEPRNKEYRGVALKELSLLGFSLEAFRLWGFEANSPKNMVGGAIRKSFGGTQLNSIIYNYSDRTDDETKELIRKALQGEQIGIGNKIIWEQLASLELEQNLGELGTLNYLMVNQEQIKNSYSREIMSEAKLELPLSKSEKLIIGYRDIPANYDPLLRDRTPEFDETTGHYLGYNLVDRYRDTVGFYGEVQLNLPESTANFLFSDLKTHDKMKRFLLKEVSFSKSNKPWSYDLFSRIVEIQRYSNTQITDVEVDKFYRLTIKRQYSLPSFLVTPGAELRSQDNEELDQQRLALFVQCERNNIKVEAGIKHKLAGEELGGKYWLGLNYQAPNGIYFRYRYTYIPQGVLSAVPDGRREYYDPDYKLLEPDNIIQISAEVSF